MTVGVGGGGGRRGRRVKKGNHTIKQTHMILWVHTTLWLCAYNANTQHTLVPDCRSLKATITIPIMPEQTNKLANILHKHKHKKSIALVAAKQEQYVGRYMLWDDTAMPGTIQQ